MFFFNETATTEIYTLSLHDALPICSSGPPGAATHPAAHRAAADTSRAGPARRRRRASHEDGPATRCGHPGPGPPPGDGPARGCAPVPADGPASGCPPVPADGPASPRALGGPAPHGRGGGPASDHPADSDRASRRAHRWAGPPADDGPAT